MALIECRSSPTTQDISSHEFSRYKYCSRLLVEVTENKFSDHLVQTENINFTSFQDIENRRSRVTTIVILHLNINILHTFDPLPTIYYLARDRFLRQQQRFATCPLSLPSVDTTGSSGSLGQYRLKFNLAPPQAGGKPVCVPLRHCESLWTSPLKWQTALMQYSRLGNTETATSASQVRME